MSFGDLYDLATGKPKLPALNRPAPVEPAVIAPVAAPAEPAVDRPVNAAVTAPVEAPAIAPVKGAASAPVTSAVEAAAAPAATAPVAPPVKAEATAPVERPVAPPVNAAVTRSRASSGAPVKPAVTAPVKPAVAQRRPVAVSPPKNSAVERTEPSVESDPSTAPLDATHTSAEAKLYGVMYRGTLGRGTPERRFTVPELMKATGIRSDKTVRTALHGLAEKLSVTVVDRNRSSNHGPLYRVNHPRDVLATRRKVGLRIDDQTKRIVGPVIAPVTAPVGRAVAPAVTAPANFTGAVTDRSLHVFHEHDDDMNVVRDAILQLVPSENDAAVSAAVTEIATLVADSIREAGLHAKSAPATAAYAVECVRRSIGSRAKQRPPRRAGTPEADRAAEAAPETEETTTTLLERVAQQFRHGHPEADDEAVVDRLREFVKREGWDVGDADLRALIARVSDSPEPGA